MLSIVTKCILLFFDCPSDSSGEVSLKVLDQDQLKWD